MAEYKDVELLKKQIDDFKRAVNSVEPMHSDYLTGYISALSVVEGAIAEKPAADVAPVCHGHWIECNYGLTFECSVCKYPTEYSLTDYCPKCSAKMDGDPYG